MITNPVRDLLEKHTGFNRYSAVIRRQYKGSNVFEFTITAQGEGSAKALTFDSGYANISIDNDYYKSPSLYYNSILANDN